MSLPPGGPGYTVDVLWHRQRLIHGLVVPGGKNMSLPPGGSSLIVKVMFCDILLCADLNLVIACSQDGNSDCIK